MVNAGDGRQQFWWHALAFDNYFMVVKGMMFAAFFYAFLPRPARGHTKLVYMLLAFMWPLFSFVLARDGLCRRLGQLMGPNEAQLPHRSVDSCVHMDAGVPLCPGGDVTILRGSRVRHRRLC